MTFRETKKESQKECFGESEGINWSKSASANCVGVEIAVSNDF